jgi:two-component system, NarL family, response regulator NreC
MALSEFALDACHDGVKSSASRSVIACTRGHGSCCSESRRARFLKDSAESDLLEALRTVLAGGTYLRPALGARLIRGQADLIERETDVLRLVALGHTNGDIATQMGLSLRTVETERAHIHRKMGRRARAGLVRCALERGLLGRP